MIRVSVTQVVYCAKKMNSKTITFLLTLLVVTSGYAEPFAYSVNSDGPDDQTSDSLFLIDLADGSAQSIGKVRDDSDIEGLAFDIDGALYGVDDADETVLRINTDTGLGTLVNGNAPNLDLGENPDQIFDYGMTFTCDNIILISSDNLQTLYRSEIDALPDAEEIGSTSSLSITGLAAWGDNVFGIGQGVEFVNENPVTLIPNLYDIDPLNGTASLIGALGGLVAPYDDAGLAFDSTGQLWALTDRSRFGGVTGSASELLRINSGTGEAEQAITLWSADDPQVSVVGFESLAITAPGGCESDPQPPLPPPAGHPEAIPAMSTYSLAFMGLILALVGLLRIRRFN